MEEEEVTLRRRGSMRGEDRYMGGKRGNVEDREKDKGEEKERRGTSRVVRKE